MELREWLLFIHIAFGAIWVGGAVLLQVLGMRAMRAGPDAQVEAMRTSEVAGRIFMVSGIVVLAMGIWLVIDSPVYGFDQAWISIALTIVLLSAILGMAFYAPQTRAALATAEQEGPSSEAFQSRVRRIATVSTVETLALFVVIYVMVFKPGL